MRVSQAFGPCSQLVIYHFMFDPSWDEGCKSCSFWADNFNGIPVHLRARDTALVAISRAPLAKLQEYQQRMGWSFAWLSSSGNDFNSDFRVSFTQDETSDGRPHHNFDTLPAFDTELPGISVFSTYSRGIDIANGAYNFLDMTPKGRDEAAGEEMSWLRRHDQYDS